MCWLMSNILQSANGHLFRQCSPFSSSKNSYPRGPTFQVSPLNPAHINFRCDCMLELFVTTNSKPNYGKQFKLISFLLPTLVLHCFTSPYANGTHVSMCMCFLLYSIAFVLHFLSGIKFSSTFFIKTLTAFTSNSSYF